MAITESAAPQAKSADAGVVTRDVADDMVAIFGAGGRTAESSPITGPRSDRSTKRRRVILPVFAGTLAAAIGAGIYAGNEAIVGPAVTPVTRDDYRIPKPVERRETDPPPVVDDVTVPTELASSVFERAAMPTETQKTPSVLVASSAAVEPERLSRAPAPAATSVAHRPAPAIRVPPAPSLPATPRPFVCDEDSEECLAPRIDDAEQRVARAFEQAAKVGVRRRDLRGYRGEWDRARRELAEQPRYALHLYAMITSDLYTLAEDVGARNDATTP